MSRVTIKEIATKLGLSTSTVSRALRDSYEISEATKVRVLEYAEKVHFRPNPIALSLKENKSHSICVIVPEIANHFFSEVINGIDFTAHQRGYNVFIYQTHESYEREKQNIENGLDRRADGFIMSMSGNTENFNHLDTFTSEDVPVVYFDRVPPTNNVNKVVVDNFKGAYDGTKYLIEKGNKRIAHISGSPTLSITNERLEGYKACLIDHGIVVDENLIRYCEFDPQDVDTAIKHLIELEKPDSFLINSDRLALNSLTSLNNLDPKLIDKLTLVGFTNMKHAHLLNPKLTTIHQPALEIGSQAANLLINLIESKHKTHEPQKIVLKTEMQF